MITTSMAFNGDLKISTDNGCVSGGVIKGRHVSGVSRVYLQGEGRFKYVVICSLDGVTSNGFFGGMRNLYFGDKQDALDARKALLDAEAQADKIRDHRLQKKVMYPRLKINGRPAPSFV